MKAKKTDRYFERLIPPVAGGLLFVGANVLSAGLAAVLLSAGVFAVTAFDYLRAYFCRTPIDIFFEDTGFEVNGKYPDLISKKPTENGWLYRYHVPAGKSLKDFESIKDAMELHLKAAVSFSFDDNLEIVVNEKRLGDFYPYEFIESENPLEVCLGYSLAGKVWYDFEKYFHFLIGSETGGGKSSLERCILTSLILSKHDIHIHLCDFQRVELGIFKKSEKVKTYCSTPGQLNALLQKLEFESNRRLGLFEEKGVLNIQKYNLKSKEKLNYHIVIIDEFAALMESAQNKDIKNALMLRVAQDRKCGVFYCLITQRPSAKVVDGDIKANLTSSCGLKTKDWRNSQLIIDESGCEKLRGAGHALLKCGGKLTELQVMYLDEDKVEELIKHTFVEKEKPKKAIKNAPKPRPKADPFS